MASSDEDEGSDSERNMDDEGEQDEDGGEFVEAAGMSEAEERLVASFMNAGEERPVLAFLWKTRKGLLYRETSCRVPHPRYALGNYTHTLVLDRYSTMLGTYSEKSLYSIRTPLYLPKYI